MQAGAAAPQGIAALHCSNFVPCKKAFVVHGYQSMTLSSSGSGPILCIPNMEIQKRKYDHFLQSTFSSPYTCNTSSIGTPEQKVAYLVQWQWPQESFCTDTWNSQSMEQNISKQGEAAYAEQQGRQGNRHYGAKQKGERRGRG